MIGVVSALFLLGLVLRQLGLRRLCALCFGVSGAWVAGLLWFWLGLEGVDPLLLALLLGASASGGMYWLSSKLEKKWQVFKLPFFLSALALFALLLRPQWALDWWLWLILALLWGLAGLIFVWRESPGMKKIFERVVECCKNW